MLYRAAVAAALVLAGSADAADAGAQSGSTCYDLKSAYQSSSCCNANLAEKTHYTVSKTPTIKAGANPCAGQKPTAGFENFQCVKDNTIQAAEQAGANVTLGYTGLLATD